MAHIISPAAEAILDQAFQVHNHGFVRLIDYLGGDERIVQAARVSYGAGTKTVREDSQLIHYLLKHGHTSPFEQVILTFHAKMPIFVARQWVRHRTARINEMSGRYSVLGDEFYLPLAEDIRFQSKKNKQGRAAGEVPSEMQSVVLDILKRDQSVAYASYEQMLNDDISRELARINLPLSLYTQWYWQIDLHNLFHFLKLRLDPHAQKEIRAYGEAMAPMAKAVAPIAYEAFEEYSLFGVHLSRKEAQAIKALICGDQIMLDEKESQELHRKLGIL